MRFLEFLAPTPPLTEEELQRVRSTSRRRYSLRVTGWSLRVIATVAAVTIGFKLVADPAFRDRALSWRFLAEGIASTAIAVVVIYGIAFAMWPAARRIARDRQAS